MKLAVKKSTLSRLCSTDMLTVEEQQNSIRYSVKLDHCYTSRLSPSDPKPRDPLPVVDSPTSDDGLQYARSSSPAPGTSKTSPTVGDAESMIATKPKGIAKTVSVLLGNLQDQHSSLVTGICQSLGYSFQGKPVGRPRKNVSLTLASVSNNSRSPLSIVNTPKSIGHSVSRNLTGVLSQQQQQQQLIGKRNYPLPSSNIPIDLAARHDNYTCICFIGQNKENLLRRMRTSYRPRLPNHRIRNHHRTMIPTLVHVALEEAA